MKYRGTLGTAVCNFFYVYYQFPFLLSLPTNRNYPSQASHSGSSLQVGRGSFMAAGQFRGGLVGLLLDEVAGFVPFLIGNLF
jgi:hypothetical protein